MDFWGYLRFLRGILESKVIFMILRYMLWVELCFFEDSYFEVLIFGTLECVFIEKNKVFVDVMN